MKTIPLTQGKVALVDDEDFAPLSVHKWNAVTIHGQWYATRGSPNPILMHRQILGIEGESQKVDHWDGNGLNNRRTNLRIATHGQNITNQTCRSRSGFKGVHQTRNGRFSAAAARDYIGTFPTPELAARAYDAAARERWGEFCCVNFPLPGERSALTGEIRPLTETEAA